MASRLTVLIFSKKKESEQTGQRSQFVCVIRYHFRDSTQLRKENIAEDFERLIILCYPLSYKTSFKKKKKKKRINKGNKIT